MVMETAPSPAALPAAIEDGFLAAVVEQMAARWRTSAGRIERYAPQVAEAWRQAAEDAERALKEHPARAGLMREFREELCRGVAAEMRAALATFGEQISQN